ncbi:hypothetical protein XACJK48_7530001 [Xanthomonas citri pv. citri]|nr:hypothetical protein XAC1083_740037 [Xanthomonas citri pv. citri]CEJ48029.1 hypothetical protein XAB3213_4050002 [Xanthomonas citri pv. bilvae]CEE56488.1 hypothetical protein XAC3608_1380002 [Xanthomonas citri pv. citri]CEE72420.1 hypothetical protein XAC71A_920079 [Xanthomonas citri pv. citri]CEH53974.1 hypothetical protein XACLE3_7140002 [Xanthomonas citri pv. citri]
MEHETNSQVYPQPVWINPFP